MRRRIGELWDSFAKAILPPDCSRIQREETRRGFYAGAFGAIDMISGAMSDEDEMTEDDLRVMNDLSKEREEYLEDLRRAAARQGGKRRIDS